MRERARLVTYARRKAGTMASSKSKGPGTTTAATKAKSATKTVPTRASLAAFIRALDDPVRRADCEALSNLMHRITGEAPREWGPSIVGFGSSHYRYDIDLGVLERLLTELVAKLHSKYPA